MDELRKFAPLHSLQPPYNLFERDIETETLPYCRDHGLATITYGGLCRGLLSGTLSRISGLEGDDLRNNDPRFQGDRFARYLGAVNALDHYARERFNRSALALALRWLTDQQGVTTALWGARRPDQLDPVTDIDGWSLSADDMRVIDDILAEHIQDPVGPEFMAPPSRKR